MFNKNIKSDIRKIFEALGNIYYKTDLAECKKCGCLIRKHNAFYKSRIENEKYFNIYGFSHYKDVIKKDYYCKIHKPKN